MTQRTDRVQELARRVLGELIPELKDPRIGFATVTAVKVTPDLRHARVAVSVYGSEEDREATLAGLRSASPRLRGELGHQLKMKYTPELTFELDDTQDVAERIEGLLKKLHEDEGQG